jgi:hypothetical protein
MSARPLPSPGAALPAPPSQAPQWLQSLLYMAAEQLAMQWNAQAACIDFKAMAGADDDTTFRASVVCEPLGTSFRLVVFHPATGRYVCRSQAVVLDTIDAENWNTDLSPAIAEGDR